MSNKKKKFYAVKNGYNIGIFETWEECENSTHKFPGAIFKSFDTYKAAEDFINDIDKQEEILKKAKQENILIAYVDGSFSEKAKLYSYGCVLIEPNGNISKEKGVGSNEQALLSRNIAGELKAAMFSVNWAIQNNYKSIIIRHDLAHTGNLINGTYKAGTPITQEYVRFITEKKQLINMYFEKVKGHSGDEYNDLADKLAGDAIKENIGEI